MLLPRLQVHTRMGIEPQSCIPFYNYRQGCRGAMEYRLDTLGYMATRPHTCRTEEVRGDPVGVYVAMAGVVDGLALSDLSLTPARIWDQVRAQFYPIESDNAPRGLSDPQTIARVYRVRRQSFGGDIHGTIEMPPLSLVQDANMAFFQFHYSTVHADAQRRPERIIGWAHSVLLNLLRYNNVPLFVDGTFRCVPRNFAQCVVLVVHNRASGLFVPVCYVLTTSRTAQVYTDLLHIIMQSTDYQLQPADVVCAFEAGLISAIEDAFPNADIIGCLFHFKQAIRRKMKKMQIPESEIVVAMSAGMVDMLTVINPDQIADQDSNWVRKKLLAKCRELGFSYSSTKWATFWRYFAATWLEGYSPAVWNVHGLDHHVIARTNNP